MMPTTKHDLSKLTTLGHYQIEAMAVALQKAAHEADTDTLPYLVQAVAMRIIELNGALLGMVDRKEWDGNGADLVHAVLGNACYRGEVSA